MSHDGMFDHGLMNEAGGLFRRSLPLSHTHGLLLFHGQ